MEQGSSHVLARVTGYGDDIVDLSAFDKTTQRAILQPINDALRNGRAL
jgi:hypothetical protein